MRYKKFQKEDYARAALHNGFILAHDTGGGKTLAAFTWPLLKVGFRVESSQARDGRTTGLKIHPLGSILIVSKENFFHKFHKESNQFSNCPVTPFRTQPLFL